MKTVKVLVTGAAGQIGYALLFRIASGQMFGPNVAVELQLLELEQALAAAEGVIMELEDCAFPLLKSVMVTSDVNVASKDVNWAIYVGAVPRRQGMERSDLLKVNGGIFGPQGQALNAHAASDVRVLVVGNPCNTNCLITMNHAPDIPNDRFFAMTMLDENRARAQLAKKANVAISEVSHLTIWGNHSATQYPDFPNARISGQPVADVISDSDWLQNTFIQEVQQRGAAIIKARGLSSAASAANAAIDTVYNIVHDTPDNGLFSVACCSQGQYGIDEGLIFSYPCRVVNGQLQVVEGIEHEAFGQDKLALTHQELCQEREAVAALIQ